MLARVRNRPMGRKKQEEAAEVTKPEVTEELPDVWPENTSPITRKLMEDHGIMGPKQMDADWSRAEAIFRAHGYTWTPPE